MRRMTFWLMGLVTALSLCACQNAGDRMSQAGAGSDGSTHLLLAGFLLIVGIFYLISPKSAWQMSHGWKPKRTEPPARMLKINRVLGAVLIVIGILCVLFL